MASRFPGLHRRTNEQWLGDLRGANGAQAQNAAYHELGRYCRRVAYNRLRAYAEPPSALAELDDQTLGEYANDFAQTTLYKIAENDGARLNQFRGESPFTSWVAQITNNIVFSELRKLRYRTETHPAPDEGDEAADDNDPLDKIAVMEQLRHGAALRTPEASLEQTELNSALARCLAALPERERTALVAQEVEGRTGQEIAARLQTSRNAVYILLSAAKKRMRACLQQSGYQPGGRA